MEYEEFCRRLSEKNGMDLEDVINRAKLLYIDLYGSGVGGSYGNANIPIEFANIMLDNSPAKAGQKELYGTIFPNYVPSIERLFDGTDMNDPANSIKNMYFYSDATGTGKTTSACALLNQLVFDGWYYANKHGKKLTRNFAYYVDMNELQALYNQFNRMASSSTEMASEASTEFYRRLNKAKEAKILVIDDIGVRSVTEGLRGDIHDLINSRVTSRRITIYTSNLEMQKMAMSLDTRLWDRIRHNTFVVEFKGKSKRKGVN
ncbi:putative DNA replication protein [Listeria phage LP-032]|uniref:DNA replication protein n=5 Tax=Homburgvirus TaxID=1921125 RepID=A0A5A4K4N2_9CAUD|nr:DnaC-like helicase loader [Listeria phage P70]YP_008240456.1 DnaC-like helicase loader [Listeria phage LP-110]YP_009044098.1 DnaC-like helicase loader [Listeria phage LP-026]AHL18886.1 putative DNA replication protein [Listeria phage LP-032]AWY07674.1 DNA replication protein [Listeria phage LP-KV022]AFQ96223.1 replication initiator protein [Listeria phage P70]AGI11595.1 putative DNA replication protein [Listeria phage LP-110]AHN84707.1 putative DNA replication protein [Listeria phage LP-0